MRKCNATSGSNDVARRRTMAISATRRAQLPGFYWSRKRKAVPSVGPADRPSGRRRGTKNETRNETRHAQSITIANDASCVHCVLALCGQPSVATLFRSIRRRTSISDDGLGDMILGSSCLQIVSIVSALCAEEAIWSSCKSIKHNRHVSLALLRTRLTDTLGPNMWSEQNQNHRVDGSEQND